jgi:hypothetical protein
MSSTNWIRRLFRPQSPLGSGNALENRRVRRRRLHLESCEDRCLLATGANVLVEHVGTLASREVEAVPMQVSTDEFILTPTGKKVNGVRTPVVMLGFDLGPANAEVDAPIDAAAVRVVNSSGTVMKNLRSVRNAAIPGHSTAITRLPAGDYQMQMRAEKLTAGDYKLQVFLVGDADGDFRVTGSDIAAIKDKLGVRAGQSGYDPALDVDLNGKISRKDVRLATKNIGAGADRSPLAFSIDTTLKPHRADYPKLADGAARPLARLVGESGIPVDFVANEIMITSHDRAAVTAFAARWNGAIRAETPELASAGTATPRTIYLVRIDPTLADSSSLEDDLRRIFAGSNGNHRVSSDAGLRLLAAAAAEKAAGVDVAVNFIGRADEFADRVANEAPTGPGSTYNSNLFTWSHLIDDGTATGSLQDIGVTDAWRAMELAGSFNNKVDIAILDMGFVATADWPADWSSFSNVPFVDAIGTRGYDSNSPWHGTDVVSAAMAVPDNGFGAAGPAGPVADAHIIFTSYDFFTSIAAVAEAVIGGAEIINMSYSARVPATLSWSVLPFDLATATARLSNTLLFASAGNDNQNIDATDSFLGIRWEEAWHTPVENTGVIGVGGLAPNSQSRDPSSNFGGRNVDIFAPYTMRVGPGATNPTSNVARDIRGTSFSSPYAAGVAALIWAANPSLDADRVEDILMDTAIPSPDPQVEKYVNARDAIEGILGDVVPSLSLLVASRTYTRALDPVTLRANATDYEDGNALPVSWSSDRDGFLGSSTGELRPNLSLGSHRITATVQDSAGQSVSRSVDLTVRNADPTITINTPANGSTAYTGQMIEFRATSFDADTLPSMRLTDSQVQWSSNRMGNLGTGHVLIRTLTAGTHVITVRGTDSDGGTVTAQITLTVSNPPSTPPVVNITTPSTDMSVWIQGFDQQAGRFYVDVTFEGTATDAEDGTLTGSRLVWTTNRTDLQSAQLGTGNRITARLYADSGFGGNHIVKLTATDSSGLSSFRTVRITILGLA